MKLEFYVSGSDQLIAVIDAAACPDVGEKVNIRRKTYAIVSRSWAVDYPDDFAQRCLRVNLNCEPSDDTLP